VTSSALATWAFDPQALDVTGDLTFVIARRSGASLKGFKIELADKAADAIRGVCAATVEHLSALQRREYEPSIAIDTGAEYLAVPDEHLRRSPVPRQSSAETSGQGTRSVASGIPSGAVAIESDPQVRALFRDASNLTLLAAPSLGSFHFQFYAAVVGSDPRNRIAFIRKKNPASVVKPGHLLFAFGDRLTRVTDPLFLLDDQFDLIILDGGIVVLNQRTFDLLFRDSEALAERYPIYAEAFSALGLSEDQVAALVGHCRRDIRFASRLRQIYESGHLAAKKITLADVEAQIERLGLDRTRFLTDGRLDFSGSDAGAVLKLLNDDLFVGDLSAVTYEAGSKSRPS
jgi:hypothetical protein